jgi:hypothetical protein
MGVCWHIEGVQCDNCRQFFADGFYRTTYPQIHPDTMPWPQLDPASKFTQFMEQVQASKVGGPHTDNGHLLPRPYKQPKHRSKEAS